MFVSKELVPVSDENGNTIWIREKMGKKLKGIVTDEALRLELKTAEEREESNTVGEFHVGAWQTALLVHNILKWEGPAFRDGNEQPIPCTRENIEVLDGEEPLVEKVLEEINRRNKKNDTDPNLSAPAGSPSSKDVTEVVVVDGTLKSSARSDITGPTS